MRAIVSIVACPVSYTHLDVYKRQVNTPWLRSTRSPQAAAHLDLRTQCKSRIIDLLGGRVLRVRARRIGMQQNTRLQGCLLYTSRCV